MRRPVIVSAARTPIGSFQGRLSSIPATQLGSVVIAETLQRANLAGDEIDEVIIGNVLSSGLGQAPARQASAGARLPRSVGCTTINKVCGSGLKAVMLAAQAVIAGDAECVLAGGMESMSNAPYLLSQARGGYRLGNGQLVDSMIKDGLWDAHNNFHMGEAAEFCAQSLSITRAQQDEFALRSYRRALKAQKNGAFKREIVPITVADKKTGEHIVNEDEEPGRVSFERLPALKPSFNENGTITAGNASSISDGAAAIVIMAEEKAVALGLKPMARIIGYASFATDPVWFTTAPTGAIYALLKKTGREVSDIDLFEINEAFAACSIAVNRELDLDPEKVNVRGGAIALGHPIGASGARLLTTLIYALQDFDQHLGIASLCIGGGEAVALMIERLAR
jgi:acetyl-CoA C-acetyltransferase